MIGERTMFTMLQVAMMMSLFPSPAARADEPGQARLSPDEREALRDVMACYGRGHDAIFAHQGTDQHEALGVLRGCFAEDVVTHVVFFDGAQPTVTLRSLAELVRFVEQNAIANHYRSARNVPGNLRLTRTGAARATIESSTAAPHFARRAGDDPAAPAVVDLISARYVNDVVRDRDGAWRTRGFTLIIDEWWRGSGGEPIPH